MTARKFLTVVAVALTFCILPALTPQQADADAYPWVGEGWYAGGGIGTVSLDTAMRCKHIGASESGLIAIAAGGDITFTDGAIGAEAATDSFECPVSGALGGVVDVSDAACDTMGEVVDIINAGEEFVCVLIDTVRAQSSNNTLVTGGAAQSATPEGLAILNDGAVSFDTYIALIPPAWRSSIAHWINDAGVPIPNPFRGTRTILLNANATTTYASGTSTLEIHSVTVNNKVAGGSETDTTLYTTPGGATTVAENLDAELGSFGIMGLNDQKMLFRVNNSAVQSAAIAYAFGIQTRR